MIGRYREGGWVCDCPEMTIRPMSDVRCVHCGMVGVEQRTVRTCHTCSESMDADYPKKYCSPECRRKGVRTGKVVQCSGCGRDVYRTRRYLTNNDNFYCTVPCMRRGRSGLFGKGTDGRKVGSESLRLIRGMISSGLHTARRIAEMFGVSRSLIYKIKSGKSWKK